MQSWHPAPRAMPCQVPSHPSCGSDSAWPSQSDVLFHRHVLNPELGPQARSILAFEFLCCCRNVQFGSRCDEKRWSTGNCGSGKGLWPGDAEIFLLARGLSHPWCNLQILLVALHGGIWPQPQFPCPLKRVHLALPKRWCVKIAFSTRKRSLQ